MHHASATCQPITHDDFILYSRMVVLSWTIPTLFRAFSCLEQCLLHHGFDHLGKEPNTEESSPWFWVIGVGAIFTAVMLLKSLHKTLRSEDIPHPNNEGKSHEQLY